MKAVITIHGSLGAKMSEQSKNANREIGAPSKTAEGFLHFVTAVPQERDEMQNPAATPVGMTVSW